MGFIKGRRVSLNELIKFGIIWVKDLSLVMNCILIGKK